MEAGLSSMAVTRTGISALVFLAAAALIGAGPALAQESETRAADGSTSIDILATIDDMYGPQPPMEDCSAEEEAAILSGEIIVCRRQQDQRQFRGVTSDEAHKRYARETMNKGNPQTPDVAGEGIFKGPATISGMCLIPPCPKEPALMIDVTALPKAPPGSDADRIARGLPPLGQDDISPEEIERARREVLGLPPRERPAGSASPATAAVPAAEP